uniref:BTB/POZ domain-containing protein KCTD9-like n=1 Tax=Styela clava TaxID=7725 RepID=UPI001939534A|nr:BTB/POZ domain-containing protein KCTD9-like [Styela clava]
MKRVQVFEDETGKHGKVFAVPRRIEELYSSICKVFGVSISTLYTGEGAELDDVNLIRDNEPLYIFKPTGKVSEQEHSQNPDNQSDWISLNVGGKKFCTTRSTLVAMEPESMLAKMFRDESQWNNTRDSSGAYLLDRTPEYFEVILGYLRHGQLIIDPNINPQGVLEEARFFGLETLIEQLEILVEKNQPRTDHSPLTRKEVVNALLINQTNCELRFQGMNFSGADLSQLDLRYINFKLANLSGCNLMRANLNSCSFERATLTNAIMDGANMQGVKMLCCNAEGASMKCCNFDDPSGLKANMEGANMKGVNFEGSLMAGANLRVATLKNSNLKNCNLRGAVLAGTDLENCDLSGCDLFEANLRGCNVTGTKFEEMITPLHMTQTVP